MNKILHSVGLALSLLAFSAVAQQEQAQTQSSNSASSANTSSGAIAGTTDNNQSLNIISNGAAPKDNTPNVIAPALTTTLTETCMGSSSIGGSGPGLGITLGTTWRDGECVRRLHARELRTMGQPAIAREIMCGNVQVWDAAERLANARNDPSLACLGSRPVNEDFEVVLREKDDRGGQVKMVYSGRNELRTSPVASKETRDPRPSFEPQSMAETAWCSGGHWECGDI